MEQKSGNLILKERIIALYDNAKTIFVSIFVWGILAHGFMIFNKFSFHDDSTGLFGLDSIEPHLGLGRWMIGILQLKSQVLFEHDYSLPTFKGISFLFFIAVSLLIISFILEIESKIYLISISGIMVAFPTVTCLFGYMSFAWDYGFGILLAITGTSLICVGKKSYVKAAGVICFACSIGIYQAFFCFGLCVFIVFMIKETWRNNYSWKKFVFEGVKYIFFSLISILFYWIILKIFLKIFNMQLSSYKNLDSMGIVSFREYIKRLFNAYGAFLFPNRHVVDQPYSLFSNVLYWIFLIFLFGICLITIIEKSKEDKRAAIELAVLFAIFPIASSSIFLVTDACYSLMFYGHIFNYVFVFFLAEKYHRNKKKLKIGLVMIVLGLTILFSNYSNTCYLKANLLCENAITYFNTLITRIQSVEGYTSDLPVVYIEPEKKKKNLGIPDQLTNIQTLPYGETSIINNYAWTLFMRQWCAYNPTTLPQIEYQGLEEVKSMPIYPDDGSIQIVNGAIVVKFAESLN